MTSPHRLQPTRLLCPWGSPGNNTGVGCHFLLQGIVSDRGSNQSLLPWQADFIEWAPLLLWYVSCRPILGRATCWAPQHSLLGGHHLPEMVCQEAAVFSAPTFCLSFIFFFFNLFPSGPAPQITPMIPVRWKPSDSPRKCPAMLEKLNVYPGLSSSHWRNCRPSVVLS